MAALLLVMAFTLVAGVVAEGVSVGTAVMALIGVAVAWLGLRMCFVGIVLTRDGVTLVNWFRAIRLDWLSIDAIEGAEWLAMPLVRFTTIDGTVHVSTAYAPMKWLPDVLEPLWAARDQAWRRAGRAVETRPFLACRWSTAYGWVLGEGVVSQRALRYRIEASTTFQTLPIASVEVLRQERVAEVRCTVVRIGYPSGGGDVFAVYPARAVDDLLAAH